MRHKEEDQGLTEIQEVVQKVQLFNRQDGPLRVTAIDGISTIEFAPKQRLVFTESELSPEMLSHIRSGLLEKETLA